MVDNEISWNMIGKRVGAIMANRVRDACAKGGIRVSHCRCVCGRYDDCTLDTGS